ncbi:uncharacterized protein LOC111083063 [Limulus polyphemus]|uniref:Uncharacterized protein LOC111083063 n=1 Tax=Limulus polyphemus TaxID=6850 RepID=A0ABM1RUE4_LIMPO|nr:uncharacterized protein LOC111083063 [Limulus polyphemus]
MNQDDTNIKDNGLCRCGSQKPPKKNKKKLRFFSRRKSGHENLENSLPPGAVPCSLCGEMVVPCRAQEYREAELIRKKEQVTKETDDPSTISPEETVAKQEVCGCPNCRRERGEPLTVELLPMDTQVTLQTMAQDSLLFCEVL